VVGIDVRHLGEYIREQRAASDISLRQLAKLAGVSNPYLSQIERGLRKPSAEILQQIAKALRISAEALYVQAGILEHREGSGQVADAVLTDEGLNERQKQVLLEIYDAFRKENATAPAAEPDDVAVSLVTVTSALPDEALSTGPRCTSTRTARRRRLPALRHLVRPPAPPARRPARQPGRPRARRPARPARCRWLRGRQGAAPARRGRARRPAPDQPRHRLTRLTAVPVASPARPPCTPAVRPHPCPGGTRDHHPQARYSQDRCPEARCEQDRSEHDREQDRQDDRSAHDRRRAGARPHACRHAGHDARHDGCRDARRRGQRSARRARSVDRSALRTTTRAAAKPLLAAVGVADLAIEQVKDAQELYVAEARKVQTRLAEVPQQVRTLPQQVRTIPAQVRSFRSEVESRVETVTDRATEVYSTLTVRGERLVTSIRRQPSTQAAVAEGKEALRQAEAAAAAAQKSFTAGEQAVADAAAKLG
jgi:transcriptional regulator with XRE-family HTH domain